MASSIINARNVDASLSTASNNTRLGGHPSADRTLASGTDLVAWYLSAVGVKLKWLLGFLVQCFEPCRTIFMSNLCVVRRRHDPPPGGGSRRNGKLCPEKGQQTMDLDRHGSQEPSSDCLSRGDRSRRSARRFWAKIPRHIVNTRYFTPISFRIRRGDSRCATPSNQQASAENQSHRALQQHAATTRVTPGTRGVIILQKLANHIGAIKLFICHYNLTRVAV